MRVWDQLKCVSLKAGNNVGRPELYLDREVELELELEQKDD